MLYDNDKGFFGGMCLYVYIYTMFFFFLIYISEPFYPVAVQCLNVN